MKLSNLIYFVEIAVEGSFTRASEKLYISQPTLSRRIQELEAELGVDLFIRHSHSLELSSEGEQFLIEANDVLKRVNRLSHLFDDQINTDTTSLILKIGYLPNFNMSKMYAQLECFKTKHPNVQFLLKQDTPMNLAEGLLNGHYDLVFNLLTYFPANVSIEKTLFMNNQLQIVVPIHHELRNKKELHFADLKQETFILLERQQSPVIVDYVISQGIKNGFNLKANHYVKDLDEGLSMVSVGKGLAFLYSGMNDGTLEKKYRIKIISLENAGNDHDIVAAYNPKKPHLLVEDLFTFIKNY